MRLLIIVGVLFAAGVAAVTIILLSMGKSRTPLQFDNQTDQNLCAGFSRRGRPSMVDTDCGIKPNQESTYDLDCKHENLVWVTISLGAKELYSRAATCGEWSASGEPVIIQKRGDEFVVTDSLPDAP